MTRQPIESSMLTSVGYAAEIQALEVEFKRGDLWQYSPVEERVFRILLDPTASAGRVFNAEILRNPAITATKVDLDEVMS